MSRNEANALSKIMTKLDVNEKLIYYNRNEIRSAILNNDKIEDKLHVIAVMSNPFNFKKRLQLAKEFSKRMYLEQDVILYTVELIYDDLNNGFYLTDSNNPRHLQLKVKHPLWHKENMINLGIQKLLPTNWKAVAWIDADIEFENPHWVSNALKVLNGCRDIIQLFSHANDMDHNQDAMNISQSFGFMCEKEREHSYKPLRSFHPGYAWACTRRAYEKVGGIFEMGILGSGDHHIAMCLIQNGKRSVHGNSDDSYKRLIDEYQYKCANLRLGYIPGVIRHYYHGTKENRKYVERWSILLNCDFKLNQHITTNKDGILVPTETCPKKFLDGVLEYFASRKEDD